MKANLVPGELRPAAGPFGAPLWVRPSAALEHVRGGARWGSVAGEE